MPPANSGAASVRAAAALLVDCGGAEVAWRGRRGVVAGRWHAPGELRRRSRLRRTRRPGLARGICRRGRRSAACPGPLRPRRCCRAAHALPPFRRRPPPPPGSCRASASRTKCSTRHPHDMLGSRCDSRFFSWRSPCSHSSSMLTITARCRGARGDYAGDSSDDRVQRSLPVCRSSWPSMSRRHRGLRPTAATPCAADAVIAAASAAPAPHASASRSPAELGDASSPGRSWQHS